MFCSATSFMPEGPMVQAYMVDMMAASISLEQMLLDAFSLRICCSLA